jgi:hypothetical protein
MSCRNMPSFIFISMILSVALLTGCSGGESEEEKEPQVLATVGDSVITYDLVQEIYTRNSRNVGLSPQEEFDKKKFILTNIVEAQLISMGVVDEGFDPGDEFMSGIENERQKLITGLFVDDRVAARSEPTQEELDDFFSRSDDEVKVALLKLDLPYYLAEQIYEKLKSGGDFAKMAVNYSVDIFTKNNGGESYFKPISFYDDVQREAIENLETGEISKPVFTRDHFWIFKLLGRRTEEKSPDVNDFRGKIPRMAMAMKSHKLMDSLENAIYAEYEVRIDTAGVEFFEERIREKGFPRELPADFDGYFTPEEEQMRIAAYSGGEFRIGDFAEGFKHIGPALYPTVGYMDSYRRFIWNCMKERLLALEAEKQGYADDPRVRMHQKLQYMRTLTDHALRSLVFKDIKVTDQEIADEYKNNPDTYRNQPFNKVAKKIEYKLLDKKRFAAKDSLVFDLMHKYQLHVDIEKLKSIVGVS